MVKYETPEAAALPAPERALLLGTSFYAVVAGSFDSIYAVDGHRVNSSLSGLLNASRVELPPGLHVVEVSYWGFIGGGNSSDLLYEFAADFQAGHVYRLGLGGCSHDRTELAVTAPDGTTRAEKVPCRKDGTNWHLSQLARQTCPATATAYWRGIPLAPWNEDLQTVNPDVPAGVCGVWFYSMRGVDYYDAPLLEARIVPLEDESVPAVEYAVRNRLYAHWRLAPGSYVLAVNDVSAQTERRWKFQCADGEAIFVGDFGVEVTGFWGHKGWSPMRLERVNTATGTIALRERFLSAGVSTEAADEAFDLKCVPRAAPKPDQVSQ